jgi:prepilin-type N-terminal cleavage/methylation domain-containing protein
MPPVPSRPAFTLVELLAVLALAGLALTLATVTQQKDRAAMWKQTDIQRLGAMQAATSAFALSHQDILPSLLPGGRQAASQYPPSARYTPEADEIIRATDTDITACAKWAIHIIRKRGGRTSADMPLPSTTWLAPILWNHLILAEFLDMRLPSQQFVSAADKFRLRWHDIAAHDAGAFGPYQPQTLFPHRWPYSASFEMVPVAWSPDYSPNLSDGAVAQGATNALYQAAGLDNLIGLRRLTDVRYASRKICWFDSAGRYSGRRHWYYAQPECEGLSSTFDGNVHQRTTGFPIGRSVPPFSGLTYTGYQLNPGWYPLTPSSSFTTTYSYEPQLWEPAKRNGTHGAGTTENLRGFQRFTRQGLAGIDFGGQEIR